MLILVPFAALALINLLPKQIRAAVSFWSLVLLFTAQMAAVLLSPLFVAQAYALDSLVSFLRFNMYADNLSAVLLFSVALAGLASTVAGWALIKSDGQKLNFASLLLVALIGINGISMVRDLFSLYVFIEVTAVASFIMIALNRDNGGLEASFKYLILSVVASTFMLTSIALFVLVTGSVSFEAVRISLAGDSVSVFAGAGLILFLIGLFIKGGLVPFHGWLPDAYSASPTAVSVFLAGIVTKASGIFSIIRILTATNSLFLPLREALLILGAVSVVIGALAALGQKDMKRMLAYSSISQMGYIILGLGAGNWIGLFAALFHFVNHAVFKAQLFINAAAVESRTGSTEIEKFEGIAAKMPVTGVSSAIAALSTAGVPPLSGFWSKLLIIISLWTAGLFWYTVIAVLASVLTLAYFLQLQRGMFWGKPSAAIAEVKEAGTGVVAVSVILTSITVLAGIAFPLIMNMVIK